MINYKSNICFECGSIEKIQDHHIIPKVLGGTKTIPLCTPCHSKVHSKDLTKFSRLARIGRKKAMDRGVKMGRKVGSRESIETFLSKPQNIEIGKLLDEKLSYRKIGSLLNCSPKTVVKVNKLRI
tara:strand:+ start:862 stop:1236 length:375 start_codon:yes stop_codon:yes gene_type:complete